MNSKGNSAKTNSEESMTTTNKAIEIKGLDLNVDDSIHKLCVTSNATSSNTRGILYFIVLVCLLSLISVLNTVNKHNWIGGRIDTQKVRLDSIMRGDSLREYQYGSYYYDRIKLEALNYSMANNYMVVKLPILGTTFDINDLAIVSGVTFIFLLLVLRFTIIREASNLNIALNAISARYPNEANERDFRDDLPGIATKFTVQPVNVLAEINRTRREHHYNFLCMNEVFNFPPLKADNNIKESKMFKSLKSTIVQTVFYLPAFSYLLIVINDHLSLDKGIATSPPHTQINYVLMFVMLAIIVSLCWRCIRQENLISKSYTQFFKNDFQFLWQQTGSAKIELSEKAENSNQ